MEITNPRRILAVSSAESAHHLTRVIKDLTGTIPEQASTSLAGASHNLSLKTAYYTAEVPIWLDLIASPSEWSDSFLSAEAKEVLEVLGGLMIVFALPAHPESEEGKVSRNLIQQVGKVVKEGLGGWEWDGVSLCLGVGEIDDVDIWEDCCAESGLEFVQVRSQATPSRNEFGEKTGIPRALEALEANDWANASADDLGSDFEDIDAEIDAQRKHRDADDESEDIGVAQLNPRDLDFGFDPKDFEGLRRAIWDAGNEDDGGVIGGVPGTAATEDEKRATEETEESLDDEDIQKIERMMTKLQAVRESNAGLPEDQRKRAAAKAVAEVMKEL
ncbi:hypothetical protein F5Y14DRAFT_440534 [Nemania sp. NC0429]|nr:hypothetical protein F5Y14DRAFT_440534 [Nemania sp. NC0429]